MKKTVISTALAASLLAASCQRAGERDSGLIELQRVRAGDIDVVLLSDDSTLRHGRDMITIEFRRDHNLVDVGTVKAGATMPMAGLPNMLGSVFLDPGDAPGRYKAETDLSMSGGWQLTLDWDGPAGRGTATFEAVAE